MEHGLGFGSSSIGAAIATAAAAAVAAAAAAVVVGYAWWCPGVRLNRQNLLDRATSSLQGQQRILWNI